MLIPKNQCDLNILYSPSVQSIRSTAWGCLNSVGCVERVYTRSAITCKIRTIGPGIPAPASVLSKPLEHYGTRGSALGKQTFFGLFFLIHARGGDMDTLSDTLKGALPAALPETNPVDMEEPGESSPPSSLKAFGVFELLEAILLLLPLEDILFAQAVCKHWCEVITNSNPLQEALFFKPAGPFKTVYCQANLYERVRMPPDEERARMPYTRSAKTAAHAKGPGRFLFASAEESKALSRLQSYIPSLSRDIWSASYFKLEDVVGNNAVCTPTLNPLLLREFRWFRRAFQQETTSSYPLPPIDAKHDTGLPKAYQHPDASWRRMLLSRPPLESVEVFIMDPPVHRHKEFARKKWLGYWLSDEKTEDATATGLTMGRLRSLMEPLGQFKVKVQGAGKFEE
jgi:hypothetical protein